MKLYIIGNGFDIGHRIQCKYYHFFKYLNQNRKDILLSMHKFYDISDESDLWSDFEKSLEEDINYDVFSEIIGKNSPNFLSDEFSDSEWYDAQFNVERESEDLLKKIRSGFEEWITSLNILEVVKKYTLDKSALYITFNYTNLLEHIYKIPTSQILHIHNKVGEALIFGHGKKAEDFNVKKALYGDAFLSINENGIIESGEVGHEHFAEDAICSFYEKMRKNTEKIIENHNSFFNEISKVDEIVILGHSYNQIDFPYFEKISKSVTKNAKWILCYFSEQDKESAKKVTENLNISSDLQEYAHCSRFEIIDSQLRLFSI